MKINFVIIFLLPRYAILKMSTGQCDNYSICGRNAYEGLCVSEYI